jgi:hypothetical protein
VTNQNPWDKYQSGSGGTSTPTTGGTPVPGATPRAGDRSARQAYIHGLSNDKLQTALRAGVISEAEVAEVWGPNKIAEINASPWATSNERDLANAATVFAALPPGPPPPPEATAPVSGFMNPADPAWGAPDTGGAAAPAPPARLAPAAVPAPGQPSIGGPIKGLEQYDQQAVATLYDAAAQAGFTGDGLHMAVATALAESGGKFNAENRSKLGVQENSMGAWQINLDAHAAKVPGATFEQKVEWLKDPYNAAKIAFQVSSGGTNWQPWSVWHDKYGKPAEGLYSKLAASGGAGTANVSPRMTAVSDAVATANGGAPVIATAPPPPVRDSAEDLKGRGAIALGDTVVLNGTQYRNFNQGTIQQADGWHIVGPDGQPTPTAFKTQAAAKAAQAFTNRGPAVTAQRPEWSPLARAAQAGGAVPQVENSNFTLNSIDQMIGAGATKGNQRGDILTTVRPGFTKGSPLEVTLGGIPSYGGFQPVQAANGNVTGGYTGQLPGNIAIGQSAPVTGNTAQDVYWLQQQGIPPEVAAKLSQGQMLSLNEAIGNLRAQGLMPDLAQQLARSKLPTGGVSKQEYEAQLNRVLEAAKFQNLEFLPDYGYDPLLDPENNPDPMANRQGMYDYDGSLLTFAKGGSMNINGPHALVDITTNEPKALIGEGGMQENITLGRDRMNIQPTNRPQTRGFNPYQNMGQNPMRIQPYPYPNPGMSYGMPDQVRQRLMGILPQVAQRLQARGITPPNFGGLQLFADGGTVYSGYGGAGGGWSSVTQNPYSGVQGENPMTSPDRDYADMYPGPGKGVSAVTIPAMYKQGTTTPQGYYIPGADDLGESGMLRYSPGVGMTAIRHRNAMNDFRTGSGGMLPAGGPIGYRMDGTGGAIPVYSTNPDLHARMEAIGNDNFRYVPTTINGRPAYLKQFVSTGGGGDDGTGGRALLGMFGSMFGWGGEDDFGSRIDPLREATDRRDYEIQAANYRAAGMTPPAVLDLLDTDDEGNPYYRKFSGTIPNGMRLPFGYDPSRTGAGRRRSPLEEMADRGRRIGSALTTGFAS